MVLLAERFDLSVSPKRGGGSISICSMSRDRSHCPAKLSESASDRGSLSIRSTCADKFARSSPRSASSSSSSSGIVDHRKYDNREASEYSSMSGYFSVAGPGAAPSTRKMNRGEASTATIVRPMPVSNVWPGVVYSFFESATSRPIVASSTGRR